MLEEYILSIVSKEVNVPVDDVKIVIEENGYVVNDLKVSDLDNLIALF